MTSPHEAPESPGLRAARGFAFVALNVTLVAFYIRWLVSALPPLVDEGPELVVQPVCAVALLGFTAMYPLLVVARTHLARLSILGAGILASTAAYALFFLTRTGAPEPSLLSTPMMVILLVLVQLTYGAPLFLAIAVLNKAASRVLIARPVRAWA